MGQTLTLTGPKVWSTNDVIKLCEARARAGEHMRLTWQMNMIYIYIHTQYSYRIKDDYQMIKELIKDSQGVVQ